MTQKPITTIQFHGASLLVQPGDAPDTTIVAMRPMVEGMSLDWASQFTKLKNHPVLSPTVVEITTVAEDGRERKMIGLPLNRIHFWMATLHPNKIPDLHVREKVIIFQNEAADALFDRFFGRAIAKKEISNGSVGGVMKNVLTKHDRETLVPEVRSMMVAVLSEVLPDMARSYVAHERYAIGEGVTAGDVLDIAGFTNRKGRFLPQFVSKSLRQYHLDRGIPMKQGRLGSAKAIMFDPLWSQEWMRNEGRAAIERKIAERAGQGNLRLVAGKAA